MSRGAPPAGAGSSATGCGYPADIETLAVLVDESSPWRFGLFLPETTYRVKEPLPAKQAIAQAEAFVRCGIHTVRQVRLRRIAGPCNATIGFEMHPLYVPYEVGSDQTIDIPYSLRGDVMTASVRLDPRIEPRERVFDVPDAPGD